MDDLSVNSAIEQVSTLNGKLVTIVGALSLEFEGGCIDHIPQSENINDDRGPYSSSIWIDFDLEAIGHNEVWLRQFDKRHVRVMGVLAAPLPEFGGCGHFSLWPAELMIKAIEKNNPAQPCAKES